VQKSFPDLNLESGFILIQGVAIELFSDTIARDLQELKNPWAPYRICTLPSRKCNQAPDPDKFFIPRSNQLRIV
jgi:hypothetical protein